MCGLAGVILKNKKRSSTELKTIADNFQQMLLEADTRGGHATGFAIIDNKGDYLIHKTNKDAFGFLDTEDAVTALDLVSTNATCIMGHTRYATLGSPNINKNNHPIRTGKTIGTHNGSIHNHKELFKKYNMQRFAQVDSEAIFRLYETSDSLKEFAENRLPRLRKMISLLSNLGNSQYELTDEQSHKIIRILKSDITMLENKLLNRKSEVKSFNVKL